MLPILLSTSYLPPIAWMALLAQQKEVRIELGETYPKQTYRNRCEIAMPQGKMDLSIPVKRPLGSKTKTYDIVLDPNKAWQRHHLRSIETAYASSPFYMYYKDDLERILKSEHTHLHELNKALLHWLTDSLNIDTTIHYTHNFTLPHPENNKDYRFVIHPKNDSDIIGIESIPTYQQVFSDKYPFIPMLSVIDLLFNLGPEATYYLQNLIIRWE